MGKIVGHRKEIEILNKLVEENKVGHAYLFLGTDGIGKKLVAVEFAKKILALENEALPESDFKIIGLDADIIKIDEIRGLIDEVYLKPVVAKHKVIIIDNADNMNVNAQNALLKVLEEPPFYATIILIVSNREKIIKTIWSRVTEIKFENLSDNELRLILGDEVDITYAGGSVKKALSLAEGDCYTNASDLADLFLTKNFLEINRKVSEIKSEKENVPKVLEFVKLIYNKSVRENMIEKLRIIEVLDDTINNLNRNANLDLALDKMIIKICDSNL